MNTWFKRYVFSPLINHLGQRKERKYFSKVPIFIGGCARSGTSLLLSILSAHPSIFCFPKETDAFTEWEGEKPVRIDRMYRELLKIRVPESTHRWCEKRPYNILYVAEILRYFKSARFIHIVRDPRYVCTSVHPERPNKYWVSPQRYIRDVNAGLKYKDHPQVLTIRYEDLVIDFDKTIHLVCEFIDEEPYHEILNWYEYAMVRSNRAWFTDLQSLDPSSIKRWKDPIHTDRVKEILANEKICGLMGKMNYK